MGRRDSVIREQSSARFLDDLIGLGHDLFVGKLIGPQTLGDERVHTRSVSAKLFGRPVIAVAQHLDDDWCSGESEVDPD